jgi:Peptidase propeptide and YPEB domain
MRPALSGSSGRGFGLLRIVISRRKFMELSLMASLFAAATPAFASDDDGGGDNSGPGGEGGNSGPGGGGNSGPGGGDDSGSGNDDSNDNDESDSDDYKRARDAYRSGQAASLKKIIARVRRDYPGDVVSVSLRGKGEKLIYRIKIIDSNNRVITLRVDARTGNVIRRDGI